MRVDACGYLGLAPPPQFDPLLAKVIGQSGSAGTFESAIDRTERALAEFHIAGVPTNGEQLRAILAHPEFRRGNARTTLLAEAIEHHGFEVFGEAGAPVYHQLTTRDYAKALDFYRQVFGWQTDTVSDTDEFRYSTASFGGDPLVGIMDGSKILEGAPSNWFFFLGADDYAK